MLKVRVHSIAKRSRLVASSLFIIQALPTKLKQHVLAGMPRMFWVCTCHSKILLNILRFLAYSSTLIYLILLESNAILYTNYGSSRIL